MNISDGDRGTGDARLDRALAGLPREIEPPQDLWPGIESRLEPRRSTRRGWQWQLAAALLLVVGSSAITAALLNQREATPVEARNPITTGAPFDTLEVQPAAFPAAYAPGPEYHAARQQMLDALARRLDQLPPETRVEIEGNLAEIRRGAAKIADALAEQPGDPLLEELLLNAYQDELAMLANVDQLTRANGARRAADSKVTL